jgi:hypothetical protein
MALATLDTFPTCSIQENQCIQELEVAKSIVPGMDHCVIPDQSLLVQRANCTITFDVTRGVIAHSNRSLIQEYVHLACGSLGETLIATTLKRHEQQWSAWIVAYSAYSATRSQVSDP